MIDRDQTYRVIIAGGGPVGLFLAYCLEKANISCIVLEKREERITHSRSLGIHPVSLELFEKVGLADFFIAHGIRIRRGIALTGKKRLGTISFEDKRSPFDFILSTPQYRTEEILEKQLKSLNPQILQRGAELLDITPNRDGVTVIYRRKGEKKRCEGAFLVGCDGKNSTVRKSLNIPFEGTRYPDTYVMGDFEDNTIFNDNAAVFLHRDGLVESFPMPGEMRRWVIKTDRFIPDPDRRTIEKILASRLGRDLSDQSNTMISSFGTQKLIAREFVKGNVVLAGDSAHVVSPIGGQGMNLGWLDAWHLSNVFRTIFFEKGKPGKLLSTYAAERRKITGKVVRRSEFNMRLGRKSKLPCLRNALIRIMLNTPLKAISAKLFTMQKLDKWPV